ncbi:hypothetical protein SBOR_2610 [Sclerotinia borealis F-4128]|uniref:Uncharacterized protein n=1 Tax=Sclerotinia borealis (strain F-4128) TaxID=1432307 RepID=W9CLW3_SCLBF|nr:hypothetical protein SBOR_2610 [Sclerotinia borealis F-4128]
MSLVLRKRSGSDDLDAPPAKKSLIVKLSFTLMSFVDALDAAARYNKDVFPTYTFEHSWKCRMVILSCLSAKYKKLDEVIKAQDEAIDRCRDVIAVLDRVIRNVDTLPPGRLGNRLPVRAVEMLSDIMSTVNTVNRREKEAQQKIAKTAEMTRVVANAAKMMLAESEKRYILPFFITPVALKGCGVEIGHLTGIAATQRTTRTCAARLALEHMWVTGAIERWFNADTADVDEVLAVDIRSLFETIGWDTHARAPLPI